MEQLSLEQAFRGRRVKVDGMRQVSPTGDLLVEYWGQADEQWDGTWRCIAHVHGVGICAVEVDITFGSPPEEVS